jgi:WD40 repeat protein
MLASGSEDKSVILWDVSDPRSPVQLGTPLTGHADKVTSVAFSPDGKTLASGSGDATVILWDVSDPRSPVKLGTPLSGHTNWVWSVAFSPDGRTLASGSGDATVILWQVDLEAWQERACQRAGRNLTQAEWKRYLGDEPYKQTCQQWSKGN